MIVAALEAVVWGCGDRYYLLIDGAVLILIRHQRGALEGDAAN